MSDVLIIFRTLCAQRNLPGGPRILLAEIQTSPGGVVTLLAGTRQPDTLRHIAVRILGFFLYYKRLTPPADPKKEPNS